MMISTHGSVSRRFISIAHTGHIDHGHAALVVLIWNNNKKEIPQTNTRKLIINNHKTVVMLCWTHFNCHPFQTMRPQSNNNKKKKKILYISNKTVIFDAVNVSVILSMEQIIRMFDVVMTQDLFIMFNNILNSSA